MADLRLEDLCLGKNEYLFDPKTLKMAKFLLPDIRVPGTWDFDKNRRPIPLRVWGNDQFGDCVIGGESNQVLRLERVEQRGTIKLVDDDAITRYKLLTGCKEPGDANDTGLVVLEAMRDWHHNGYATAAGHTYEIAAYGELDPSNEQQVRMASYVLHGIHIGFWLPLAAQQMTRDGVWDYTGETGRQWQPGSWGGHLVYSKAFDPDSLEILTWGIKVKVTNAFIEKYCDEMWCVVDSLDAWRTKQTIDVTALTKELQQISGKVNE